MADNLTKEQRSFTMSRIRSKWTSQEKRLHNYLKGNKIEHRMHPRIKGSPDIILPEIKTAVFLQGCFWHKCPKHFIKPKSNIKYWQRKIARNIERDKNNADMLRRSGWKVVKIWEHELGKNPKTALKRILAKQIS